MQTKCSHNQQKNLNIKGLSKEDKRRILEAKALREEVKRENYYELQCSRIPEIFSDSHGIHIDSCDKKYKWNYFSELVFRHFQRYPCLKFAVFLFQRSSWSHLLSFQLNGCIPGYNSRTQLATVFLKKKLFFFKILLNCLIKFHQ